MDVSTWRHQGSDRLEREPALAPQSDLAAIDRTAEHEPHEIHLTSGQDSLAADWADVHGLNCVAQLHAS